MCVARCLFSLWQYEGYGVPLNVLASDLFKTYQSCIFVFSVYHNCFQSLFFILLYNRGTLFRLTITASCPMDLQYFPMDSQLCYIEIESCKYRHGCAFSSEYSLVFIHKKCFSKSVPSLYTLAQFSFYLWIKNSYQSIIKRSSDFSHVCCFSRVHHGGHQVQVEWRAQQRPGQRWRQLTAVQGPRTQTENHRGQFIHRSVRVILLQWDIFTFSSQSVCVSVTV